MSNDGTQTGTLLERPRWFPETAHEESVYATWQAEAAARPGQAPRFRDWYEAKHGTGA